MGEALERMSQGGERKRKERKKVWRLKAEAKIGGDRASRADLPLQARSARLPTKNAILTKLERLTRRGGARHNPSTCKKLIKPSRIARDIN